MSFHPLLIILSHLEVTGEEVLDAIESLGEEIGHVSILDAIQDTCLGSGDAQKEQKEVVGEHADGLRRGGGATTRRQTKQQLTWQLLFS